MNGARCVKAIADFGKIPTMDQNIPLLVAYLQLHPRYEGFVVDSMGQGKTISGFAVYYKKMAKYIAAKKHHCAVCDFTTSTKPKLDSLFTSQKHKKRAAAAEASVAEAVVECRLRFFPGEMETSERLAVTDSLLVNGQCCCLTCRHRKFYTKNL
ncbi:hypothetical protein V496_09844 [Pseudogymnoascus sp. VKM F-4515 (FW-2607)]|nr:hypothetical protein V496_09844 [Pseudogymnoascus sp. VKM F-4515 (FW-2607)]